jgi:hypothetical protein
MHVHLFNWIVSPSYIGWADTVKITASGGALKGGGSKKSCPLFLLGFENQIYWKIVFLSPNKQRFSETVEKGIAFERFLH